MRWRRPTHEELKEEYHRRYSAWHRVFALRPREDKATHTVYWLEHVWCRGVGSISYRGHLAPWKRGLCTKDGYGFDHWEYRGGKDAPEIKQRPVNMTESVV